MSVADNHDPYLTPNFPYSPRQKKTREQITQPSTTHSHQTHLTHLPLLGNTKFTSTPKPRKSFQESQRKEKRIQSPKHQPAIVSPILPARPTIDSDNPDRMIVILGVCAHARTLAMDACGVVFEDEDKDGCADLCSFFRA
ncbi:hypothetical protein EAF00_009913 [Botryotinia globosa]|nr:hypothetical protein EAF00_009913 [Botryotinia globosa]